jgi:hypothetical protein
MLAVLVVLLSQYPNVDCEYVMGTLTNYSPPGPYANISCPSNRSAATGSCPAGQFATAAIISGLTCATPSAASLVATASTSSRTLNSNFAPSATAPVLATYSVQIVCAASLVGGQSSTVELRSDASATPSTVRATAANANSVSLAIAITVSNTQTVPISYLVPAGHFVRLSATGTCTTTLVSQAEVELTL